VTDPITPPPELVQQWIKECDRPDDPRWQEYEQDIAARAALAQPEPQGPTDAELDEFAIYWWGSETDERSVSDVIECGSMAAFARAVLARWGRPAIEPVTVSERLPRPEDCDAEGRCWFFHTSTIGGNEWFLSQLPKVSEWYRWQSITHWLPHGALPVPGVEGADG
jgi:hypothetical protein